jgi:hypothetical protein
MIYYMLACHPPKAETWWVGHGFYIDQSKKEGFPPPKKWQTKGAVRAVQKREQERQKKERKKVADRWTYKIVTCNEED